jgi:hypothetical protein
MQESLKNRDMVGKIDTWLLDWRQPYGYRLMHWPGYIKSRKGELIGIGRMLSARILNKMSWKPFEDDLNNNMDYSMLQKLNTAGGTIQQIIDPTVVSMAISCSMWENKHNWEREAEHPKATFHPPMPFIEKFDFNQIQNLFP